MRWDLMGRGRDNEGLRGRAHPSRPVRRFCSKTGLGRAGAGGFATKALTASVAETSIFSAGLI